MITPISVKMIVTFRHLLYAQFCGAAQEGVSACFFHCALRLRLEFVVDRAPPRLHMAAKQLRNHGGHAAVLHDFCRALVGRARVDTVRCRGSARSQQLASFVLGQHCGGACSSLGLWCYDNDSTIVCGRIWPCRYPREGREK